MTEIVKGSPIEKFPADSYLRVEAAMTLLAHELGMSAEFINAVWERIYGVILRGEPSQKIIVFDEDGKSYGYSGMTRETKGFIPDDAMALIESENSFFLQVSHSEMDTSELRGEAELIMGDRTYKGERALRMAHKAFPRFYPAVRSVRKAA